MQLEADKFPIAFSEILLLPLSMSNCAFLFTSVGLEKLQIRFVLICMAIEEGHQRELTPKQNSKTKKSFNSTHLDLPDYRQRLGVRLEF